MDKKILEVRTLVFFSTETFLGLRILTIERTTVCIYPFSHLLSVNWENRMDKTIIPKKDKIFNTKRQINKIYFKRPTKGLFSYL